MLIAVDFTQSIKRLCVNAVLLFSCYMATLVNVQAEVPTKLSFVEEANWPPFTFERSGTAFRGLAFDLTQAVFASIDRDVELTLHPQKRMLKRLRSGEADGVSLISKNEAREKYLLFSDPLISKQGKLYYLKNRAPSIEWQNYHDLRGLTLGIVRGHNYGDEFERAFSHGDIKTIKVTRIKQLFDVLMAGRVAAVLSVDINANHILKDSPTKSLIVAARKPYFVGEYHIGLSRQGQAKDLLPAINKAIADLQASGKIDLIMANYR